MKKISVLFTAFILAMLFSFPAFAGYREVTYTAGVDSDLIWNQEQAQSYLTIPTWVDCPSSHTCPITNLYDNKYFWIGGDEMSFSNDTGFPAGTDIDFTMVFSVSARSSSNTTLIADTSTGFEFEPTVSSPTNTAFSSSTSYSMPSNREVVVTFHGTIRLNTSTKTISFKYPKARFIVRMSNSILFKVESAVMTYRVEESTNDILEDIRNNTGDALDGYDSTKGNTSKDNLTNELIPMEESEDSLFSSGKSGLDSFTFFDLSSVPAVMAGITFVTSVMTSWFSSAGGLSGVGIVLSCLFTVLIISLVLGLHKYFKK